MKEAYQQAVMESESCVNLKNKLDSKEKVEVCDTKSLKERFEKGELINTGKRDNQKDDEEEVYESGE